jgi:hypothetical protein
MAEFFASYAMLVINSFGLQNAMERSPVDIPHFFARVHSSAKTCAILVKEELGPLDFMTYAPDSHFVFTSYAVLSLLKVSSGCLGRQDSSHLQTSCFARNFQHLEITNTRRFSWSRTLLRHSTRFRQDPHIRPPCTAHSCVHCSLQRLNHQVRWPVTRVTTKPIHKRMVTLISGRLATWTSMVCCPSSTLQARWAP